MLVYAQVLGFGWLDCDDDVHVTTNPGLHPVTLRSIASFWTQPYEGLSIPLSYMLYAGGLLVSRVLSIADPHPAWLFHGTSVLLHIVCVLLVGRILTQRVAGGWPALAGMLVFALHPLQVESVAWISEQRGLLATALSLGSLCVAARPPREETSREKTARTGIALLLFVLAILAKPSATVVPLMLAILDGAGSWRATVAALGRSWQWLLVAVAIAVVTKLQQPSEWSWEGADVRLMFRPLVAADAIGFYLEKFLVPLGPCLDYGRMPGVVLANAWLCVRAVLVLVVIAIVCVMPQLRPARIPVGLSIAAFLPVLGLVPFTFQAISTVADRYAYLPMIGPAVAEQGRLDESILHFREAVALRPDLPAQRNNLERAESIQKQGAASDAQPPPPQ